MKTYKLIEVVNALEQNPYAAFKRIGDGLELRAKQTSHGMALAWDSGYRFLGFKDEFAEIIKSVPWELAFKAWSHAFSIRVQLGEEEKRFSTLNRVLDVTRSEISEGEWFIENGDASVEEEK